MSMKIFRKKFLLGSVFVSMAVLAAVYGPFRCDNGCNATDMTDGLTMAFIRSTVNQQLHQEASAAGKSFSWKPGDQLTICDGKWCVTSQYHPLTGTFIWNPINKPAYRDNRQMSSNEVYSIYLAQLEDPALRRMLDTLMVGCLRGTLKIEGESWGGDSYSWDDGYMNVISSGYHYNLGYDFCNV
ncbi:hypothetical protein [Comamonas sp. C24C]